MVKVTFIGTGDAFGSGGRLQTCILVDGPGIRLAIDFGASSLIGLRRQGIEPNTLDVIVLTHLHGDHCGGVPFLLLDAMLGSKRRTGLALMMRPAERGQPAEFDGPQPTFRAGGLAAGSAVPCVNSMMNGADSGNGQEDDHAHS